VAAFASDSIFRGSSGVSIEHKLNVSYRLAVSIVTELITLATKSLSVKDRNYAVSETCSVIFADDGD
jgi:hypothetical protein